MKLHHWVLLLPIAFTLAGCAQYAKVSEIRPQRLPGAPQAGGVRPAEQTIHRALCDERRQPLAALGSYVAAAEMAWHELDRNPNDTAARQDYNFALARIFTTIRDAKLDPWTEPLRVGAQGEYTLTWKHDPRPSWNPAHFDLIPSDQLKFDGTYVHHHVVKDGLGAPLVAYRREMDPDVHDEFVGNPHLYYGVTAVARFEGNRCVLAIEDPLAEETITVGSNTWPLAANFTAPLALALAHEHPKRLGLPRLLRPQKFAATARVARMEPYHTNKTVILVVHGLMDSPVTWTPMLNELRGDPDIRDNYQFWFYSYPTGYPYPYSAAIMRRQLDAIEKKFPLHQPMVVIGHSMGCLVSRLMITDTGDELWLSAIGTPPAETSMPEKSKLLLEETLIFEHRQEVSRVIFISGPHRGADMAANFFGRIGSWLVRAPASLASVGKDLHHLVVGNHGARHLNRMPNSIDTLEPNDPLVQGINAIPITAGIPYHSIVGDRGRGDTPDSSDGFVPYWSSHLQEAQSEKIVPSHHGAHRHPEGIEEVRRILLLHLESRKQPAQRSSGTATKSATPK